MVLGSYPGGHPLENGHMEVHGSVLGAHTQGETHWQNDTSLAGRPKDTNPYPGRDPYRGIHKGGRPPKAAAPLCGGGAKRRLLYMGLSLGTGSCLWDARPAMCRFAYGFLPGYEHRALSHVTPCVRFPMGVPLGMSPKPSNSHLVL